MRNWVPISGREQGGSSREGSGKAAASAVVGKFLSLAENAFFSVPVHSFSCLELGSDGWGCGQHTVARTHKLRLLRSY